MNLKRVVSPVLKRIALPLCALVRRMSRRTHCIAVTGSVAKSTTKELIASILAQRSRVRRSRASMNRAGELARVILSTPPWCDYLVLELGLWRPGSLDELIAMARPDTAVLTRIQRDHFRAFGSVDAIAEEKFKVVRRLPPGGLAVLNADDPRQEPLAAELAPARRVVTYGLTSAARVTARAFATRWPDGLGGTLSIDGVDFPFQTRLMGEHWIHAVLAAAAVCAALGVTADDIAAGLAACEPVRGRLSILRDPRGVTFIEDWSKGSEASCEPALACLRAASGGRRVAVFGTIADISGKPSQVYRRIATEALESAEKVFFVGLMSERTLPIAKRNPDRLRLFDTLAELLPALDAELRPGDLVLIKGSQRADHLERIVRHRLGERVCLRIRCGSGRACFDCRLKKTF